MMAASRGLDTTEMIQKRRRGKVDVQRKQGTVI
jgi:hypothetical protein